MQENQGDACGLGFLKCFNHHDDGFSKSIDKQKFKHNFVNSKYYKINNIQGYNIREQSAIGLHGFGTDWYKNTLIPIVNNKLIEECKIYHMPNNYVLNKNTPFATIKFEEAIRFNM
jgi:hypothetical protein